MIGQPFIHKVHGNKSSKKKNTSGISTGETDKFTKVESDTVSRDENIKRNIGRTLLDPTVSWLDQIKDQNLDHIDRPEHSLKNDLLDEYFQQSRRKSSRKVEAKGEYSKETQTKKNAGSTLRDPGMEKGKDYITEVPFDSEIFTTETSDDTYDLTSRLNELEMQALEKGRTWRRRMIDQDGQKKRIPYTGE